MGSCHAPRSVSCQAELTTLLKANISTIERTPAFLYSSESIIAACRSLRDALVATRTKILYSTKACSVDGILAVINPLVDGFAVASPVEARIAGSALRSSGQLHITSPGLTQEWLQQLRGVTHIAFNSLSQLERCKHSVPATVSMGIRVNPGLSYADDIRHDPCRVDSKLGVPIFDLNRWFARRQQHGVKGLHLHNSCLSTSWSPLRETVSELIAVLGPVIPSLEWINLGGGYVWDDTTDFRPLQEAIKLLTTFSGIQVYVEPGAGIINSSGYLVSSVIDLFKNGGKRIAVLDTTVNHLPEVFEYQYEPDVIGHVDDGGYEYVLAGCTCLAGDLFGEYAFEERLGIGSKVIFANVGAYSLVKASAFNGIDIPPVYLHHDGLIEMMKTSWARPAEVAYTFANGVNQC
jgi:carboxynorspermidine decarboxylase